MVNREISRYKGKIVEVNPPYIHITTGTFGNGVDFTFIDDYKRCKKILGNQLKKDIEVTCMEFELASGKFEGKKEHIMLCLVGEEAKTKPSILKQIAENITKYSRNINVLSEVTQYTPKPPKTS